MYEEKASDKSELPVVVIGGGPIGLAAAARLLERGIRPLVLESGGEVGRSVREWGHVRLFSPWRYLIDEQAGRMLEGSGWQRPDPEEHPTGAELVARYLEPLASLPEVSASLRFAMRVTAVARSGFDRMKTAGREASPFVVVASGPGGEERILARAVIDASGTWTRPNPLGSNGLPAQGEIDASDSIAYGIPDALGSDRDRYDGRHTVVVGSGHSAINAVVELAKLNRLTRSGSIVWALRRGAAGQLFGGGEGDQLPQRAALGARARELIDAGEVELVTGFAVEGVERSAAGVRLDARDGRSLEADRVVVATGFRPDLEPLRELRLELDPITEAPVRLAPLIDPNVHSCGTVPPHGEAELSHPEEGFYLVGMKSYGRAPTFLLLTGYEQVRSVVAYLAGDIEEARDVRLTLPQTGVCSSDDYCEIPVAGAGSCCQDAQESVVASSVEASQSCCDSIPEVPQAIDGDACCGSTTAVSVDSDGNPCCDRSADGRADGEACCDRSSHRSGTSLAVEAACC